MPSYIRLGPEITKSLSKNYCNRRRDRRVRGGAPGVAAGRRGDLVEADYMGSTCLNAGCIPAKCLLHTAELVSQMNEQGADIGMKVSGVEVPPGDCL